MSEPDYVEPPRPWPRPHGGPDCDCHKPVAVEAPPVREATPADLEMLGVSSVVSAPTLAEINGEPDGEPVADPQTPFDQLYNLIQNTPCPHFGPQMRFPGGPSKEWKPCGVCAVCRLKQQAKELRSKGA